MLLKCFIEFSFSVINTYTKSKSGKTYKNPSNVAFYEFILNLNKNNKLFTIQIEEVCFVTNKKKTIKSDTLKEAKH